MSFSGTESIHSPAREFATAVNSTRRIADLTGEGLWSLATIIGNDRDPQVLKEQIVTRENAGVTIAPSITKAAQIAGRIVQQKK
jgi:hypothetical protein